MPVSKTTSVRTKNNVLAVKGKAAPEREAQEEIKFLTIAPALPILPGVPVPPKLKRTYNCLSSLGSSSNIENVDVDGCDIVDLQWTGEGRTVIATRPPAEREKNPDRICLDRRGLTTFPNIIGETKLRLLSLQHNLLTKVEDAYLTQLLKLVFLDLYDNQIEKICSLQSLENLRVLLIGKNRIRKIEGLKQLSKLEVLDLHGNQIVQISGLGDLICLKVLNLAGNNIKTIGNNDFDGLSSLQELNLRRNKIKKLLGFGKTPLLQKLYLSNNDIKRIEDIGSLVKALHIKEMTIDGNPITLNNEYISFLVSYLPNLQILSAMQINEQTRRSATAWRNTKEQSNSAFLDLSTQICTNVRREEVISNAKTTWDYSRTSNSSRSINKDENSLNDEKNEKKKDHGKFNSTKGLNEKVKSKAFGSLTSINENIESKQITIKKRSNSSGNLCRLENDLKVYPLEFKLPPIVGSIIDNLTCKTSKNSLRNDSNEELNPAESSTNSDYESSESHGSLKSSLRHHLLSTNPSSFESDKLFQKNNIAFSNLLKEEVVCKSQSLSVCNTTSNTNTKNKKQNQENGKLQFFFKAHNSSSEYYSSSSKASSLDSCKSNRSDSSHLCVMKNFGHKVQMKEKNRVKSAQPKKLIYYKINRAATARVKYRTVSSSNSTPQPNPPKEREQGGDYLIEIVGRCLNVFGQGALRFIDKNWDPVKSEDVNVVKFYYAQFNSIALILGKLKYRFPNIEHFVFKETNIIHLGQLNALAETQGLTSIQIEVEGNPIVSKDWKNYAIFRLAHWGLKIINGKEITLDEVELANQEYAGLIDIVMCSLPESLLQPLLQRLHLEKMQKQNGDQLTAKQFLFNCDPALRSVVAKEALQWRKGSITQDDLISRHKGKVYLSSLINLTTDAIEKLQILDEKWPSILYEIIHKTLSDFSEMNSYMKQCVKILESEK
ncbi:leucine-rich repeat-containing protein 49 [Prorops nasuta]|uniref:leucine-rich repeat-containing protein 49 n=1 Tax=Prorops nasuta TaxID=863751 RepID=UPI0034D000E3